MTTTCPFCNSVVEVPESPPARMTCPRCGEAFPVTRGDLPVPTQSGSPEALRQPTPPATVRRTNRRLGLAIFAGMALLFVVALVLILNSRPKRGLESLAELPTLGYLPGDTNVIAAVNVPVAEESAEGREMLDRLGVAPGGAFDLERYVGLRRDQIDDAVLGLRVGPESVFPRVRLVVRTRGSYDPERLREKLGVTRSRAEGTKSIDLCKLPGLPMELALWCATSRTFVICSIEDVAKVPDQPVRGVDHLDPSLADLLRARSDRETFFWLVAHSEDWSRTGVILLTGGVPAEERKTLFSMRTLGVGLRLDSGTTTTRSRPARITEEVKPGDQRGVAADVVVMTAGEPDAIAVRDAIENRVEKMPLEIKNSDLKQNRYSVTISGKPTEWAQAIQALRAPAKKK
ncbi:MAG: hypothetical protein ACJ8F7_07975 [Gemmataceae bacterium]